jgi:Uma2 family endonuclease
MPAATKHGRTARPIPNGRGGAYTFEDFCAVVRDGQKADLIDGVIYMASPDNTDSNRLNGWLWSVMNIFAEERRLGEVFGSRVAFRIDDTNGPEPDIGFVSNRFLAKVRRGYVEHRPDVAVEIVSPDSIERDYEQKFGQYERAGVPEYWILDEIEKTAQFFRLGRGGHYREVAIRKSIFRSKALPGFWLDVRWLWEQPRRSILRTARTILRKP